MAKLNFPQQFWWGGASSAEQSEGDGITKKGETVFKHHFKQKPSDFWDKVGPEKTIDVTRHYQADIALMKQFKINSHRTSLSWARLFPEGDFSKPNQQAVNYYHQFIDAFKAANIELILVLFHFDLPQYELEKGGFEAREVWDDFLKYSAFVLKEYGPKIKYWATMNEFLVPVYNGYLAKIQPPFVIDEQRAVNAAYGIVMSHAKVVNFFNQEIKKIYPGNKIGGIFYSVPTYPRNSQNPLDVKAAKYYDLFQCTGLTDAAIGGFWNPDLIKWIKELDLWPQNYHHQDQQIIKKIQLDFIGLNYYAPARAKAPEKELAVHKFKKYFSIYQKPDRRENKFRGWEIYPQGLYDTFAFMYKRYQGKKHQYFLSEYGMGVENENYFRNHFGYIADDYRIAFMKEHLAMLHQFMNDYDVQVLGAHLWATFDCWSWNNAFKNRYGLFEVNIINQKRIPKKSATFLKEVITNQGFDNQYQKVEKYLTYDKLKFNISQDI